MRELLSLAFIIRGLNKFSSRRERKQVLPLARDRNKAHRTGGPLIKSRVARGMEIIWRYLNTQRYSCPEASLTPALITSRTYYMDHVLLRLQYLATYAGYKLNLITV